MTIMPKFVIEKRRKRYIVDKKRNPRWRLLLAEGIGKDCDGYIELHPIEVVYLAMKRRIEKISGEIDVKSIISSESKKDEKFMIKLAAYLDLKERGFPVRIVDAKPIIFEVYDRSSDILIDESKRYIMVVSAEKSIGIEDLDYALKYAKKHGKQLVLAILDQDGDIVYYKVDSALKVEVSLKLRKQ